MILHYHGRVLKTGRGRRLYIIENIILAAIYLAVAKLGLQLATVHGMATVLWLPSGLAVAALILRGFHLWPGIAVAVFLATASTGAPLAFVMAAIVGNVLEPVTAALLLRRIVRFDPAMERVRDVFGFVLLSAVSSTLFSATIGVAGMCLSGMAPWAAYGSIWWTWWLGNVMGALVVGPLILTWATRPVLALSPRRTVEAAMLVVALVAASQLVFGGWFLADSQYSLEYVVFPPMIWAAVRFGPRGATTATVLIVSLAIWGTVHGHGPFFRASVSESVLLMWFFMGVAVIQSLLLAAAVAERRHAEEAMREARDMARAAEADAQVRSAFLANMSHEIRTPIHGMLGMTGLLLDTSLEPAQREYAEILRRSGDALVTLINDTLDLSKLEAGKLDLEHMDFDLTDAIEGVVELLSQQAHSKGVELVCVIHADVPIWVNGDPSRLRQIVTNLVGNALKFTATGEVVVRVALASELPDEWLIRVTVMDTGIGIPVEAQQRLFEAFSQGDASTTRRFGGTGLGLTICKELVELMRGSIGFESEPDERTQFWFTVPLGRPQTRRVLGDVDELRGARVLCAATHAAVREALERHLAALGMEADCVDDGPQALARLRETPHALAIIEPQMTVAIGLELVDAIRRDPALDTVPLVGLSALGDHEVSKGRAGVAAFLTKPIRRAQLRERLHAVTRAPSPASQASPRARTSARILLVDDNRINQKVAVLIIEKQGYVVDVASNGREAVEACARHAYELVLMDCEMPEMDGLAATAAIRVSEADTGRRVPIVGVTGHAMPEHRARCLEAGMDDYVIKPLKPETLVAVLMRWVHGQASMAS
jgi:signal transduction histidine kinase/CheY-like chemotaxis protein